MSLSKITGPGAGSESVSQRYGSADPVPKCLGSATLLRTVCWELATDSENFAKRGISRVQIFRKTSEIIGVNFQLKDCLMPWNQQLFLSMQAMELVRDESLNYSALKLTALVPITWMTGNYKLNKERLLAHCKRSQIAWKMRKRVDKKVTTALWSR